MPGRASPRPVLSPFLLSPLALALALAVILRLGREAAPPAAHAPRPAGGAATFEDHSPAPITPASRSGLPPRVVDLPSAATPPIPEELPQTPEWRAGKVAR